MLSTILVSLITISSNLIEQASISNLLNEFDSAQTSLESASQTLLEKASSLQVKMKQIESKRLNLKQSKRDALGAKDVSQLEEAKTLASFVHGEVSKVRKMISEFNEAHSKKK